MVIKISIASDHAGFKLKQCFINNLASSEFLLEDRGCYENEIVDYPDFAYKVAQDLLVNPEKFGILICGSGIGMTIAANRFYHIRAANIINIDQAKLAREHNNANVLCLGSRMITEEYAFAIFDSFITTKFMGERHLQRVNKLSRPYILD